MAEDLAEMSDIDSDAPAPDRRPVQQGARHESDHSGLDTDSDDEPGGAGPGDLANVLYGAFHQRVGGVWPLRHRPPLDNNDALVSHLLKTDVILTPQVAEAMKLCSRDRFVPGGVRDHPDVFADAPTHVLGYGFNISAPHMHATCLHHLDLKPGHRVLDVGSGSGLLSAYAAILVGKSGSVVGIDSSPKATKLAKSNLRTQARLNKGFADRAAPCRFQTHNVFMPASQHQGQYDRIVVGASCPPEKIEWLLSLLRPEGGVIVTPVSPSDLRKVTKLPDGHSSHRVISQVRFSNLELPKEVSILKAMLEEERLAAIKPPRLESTYALDVASISGSMGSPTASSSLGSEQSMVSRGAFSETPPSSSSSWPRRMSKLFTACSSSASDRCAAEAEEGGRGPLSLDAAELGPADCAFLGPGWSLPAHKCVLRTRCELFRAQCASGMRDAEAAEVHVPEHFTKDAVAAFLRYCLTDKLEGCDDAEATAGCLAVANYYGVPHLVQLCELSLSAELSFPSEGAVRLASSLLALADDAGLGHLQARCLDFIVHNFRAVADTPAYDALSKRQTDLIAAHACTQLQHFHKLLDKMESAKTIAPDPYA